MAELQQELRALRNNPPSTHQTAEGVSVNLQVLRRDTHSRAYFTRCKLHASFLCEMMICPLVEQGLLQEREQYGRLVELSKTRDAQNALQVLTTHCSPLQFAVHDTAICMTMLCSPCLLLVFSVL